MNIIGKRIYLRATELSDKQMLLDIINDGDLENNLGGWSFPISDINQEEWIRSLKPRVDQLRCVIVIKENEVPIGTVILTDIDYKNGKAEVHIKLHPDTQAKGYGTEAIKLITKYAFAELRLNCIYASVNSFNLNSLKSFEKCGYKKEGLLRDRIYKNGKYSDVYSYSIVKEDLYGDR